MQNTREQLEKQIRDLAGQKVIIKTDFEMPILKTLIGTLDTDVALYKPFKDRTMIEFDDEQNTPCGVEFKHIIDIKPYK